MALRLALLYLCVLLCVATPPAAAFFGGGPRLFDKESVVAILAGPFTSKSKVVPLPYRDVFPCGDDDVALRNTVKGKQKRNIGQVITGDSLQFSGYYAQRNSTAAMCMAVCTAKYTQLGQQRLNTLISGNYRGNLFLDGLPVREIGAPKGVTGYRLGKASGKKGLPNTVFNHLQFMVRYHTEDKDEKGERYTIVGFEVLPASIQHDEHDPCFGIASRDGTRQMALDNSIAFTYSVTWKESPIKWHNRWDAYNGEKNWKEKVGPSLLVFSGVLVLSGTLWWLFALSLRRDFKYYSQVNAVPDRDETGWRLVSGDVFRKPRGAGLLAILSGTSVQLCGTGVLTIAARYFFVTHEDRGALLTLMVSFYVLCGLLNGFVTSFLLKMFKVTSWRTVTVAALLFPSGVVAIYIILNFIHVGTHASSTLPIGTIVYVLTLLLGVALPFSYLGAAVGFKVVNPPVMKVNNIPRSLPSQDKFMAYQLPMILAGMIVFSAAFVELQRILDSVWQGQLYNSFGSLCVVLVLLVILSTQSTMIVTYYYLLHLDYRWWWRAFFISSSFSVWLFLYSIYYYIFRSIVMGFLGTVLYFGYTAIACAGLFIMFGGVGFLGTLGLLIQMYSRVRDE